VRAPELIKISIAGLAGAVLTEENCRIWVMQGRCTQLPSQQAGNTCTIPEINIYRIQSLIAYQIIKFKIHRLLIPQKELIQCLIHSPPR
jgi:hypothetical protein